MDDSDPFQFVQDTRPSLLEQLLKDLHDFLTKSFGFDPHVWMLRVVVSLFLVIAWEVYWSPPTVRMRIQQEQKHKSEQTEEPLKERPRQEEEEEEKRETVSAEKIVSSKDCGESNAKEEPEILTTALEEPKPEPPNSTITTNTTTATEPITTTETTNEPKNDENAPSLDATTLPKDTSTVGLNNPVANNNSTNTTPTPTVVWKEPGLEGFHRWYETETSLYRIYTLATKTGETIPPYTPSSQRGRVAVELNVTNTTNRDINVYWVDYKGKYVPKGKIKKHSGRWNQTTWIDHPWVFEDALTGTPYLYFVPYKVIPTIPNASTMGSDGNIGLHKFVLTEAIDNNNNYYLGVSDSILPLSSSLDQPLKAIHWTLAHLSRWVARGGNPTQAETLQKYLVNILNHPQIFKYRHLKISQERFAQVWNSPLRGLLLAVGFVEWQGYCTLGNSGLLPQPKIQDVALLSYLLHEWTNTHNSKSQLSQSSQQQPEGAQDGFGRAGFGRAGAMG